VGIDRGGVDVDWLQVEPRPVGDVLLHTENVVKMLAAHGPLRRGLTRTAAADVVELLMDPGHFTHFVTLRGWSTKAFERWLASTLRQQLLD
jgi:hypothetical protein